MTQRDRQFGRRDGAGPGYDHAEEMLALDEVERPTAAPAISEYAWAVFIGAGLWTVANGIWPLNHPIAVGVALIFAGVAIRMIQHFRN